MHTFWISIFVHSCTPQRVFYSIWPQHCFTLKSENTLVAIFSLSLHETYLLLVLLSRRKDISLNNHFWLSDSRVGKLD